MYRDLFARRGLSFDRLRALLDVQEAGSIIRAAGGDPVRQSQFSRQIKELEEFFGVELTARQGRVLKLTAAGEELAGIVREHLVSLEDFAGRPAGAPAAYSLGAGESLIHWLVIPRLRPGTLSLPEIALRLFNLRGVEIVERLEDRSLDFGLLRTKSVPRGFGSKPLGTVRYCLAVPRSMWRGGDTARGGKDVLERYPIAMLGRETDFGERFYEAMTRAGIRANVRLECDSFPSVSRAVEAGAYAGIVPAIAKIDVVLRGAEIIPLKVLAPLTRDVSLAWLPRRLKVRPLAEEVGNWLAGNLAVRNF